MAVSEPRIVGRYELYAELAAGGMASVYLGRMIGAAGFAKSVAIKRLHPHLLQDTELVPLLLEEARLMERVRHPNVVATLDVVAEGGELLLVMEYVHGETLGRLLRALKETGQTCPPEIAARIMHDVLLGLHAAHNSADLDGTPLCIVHRDVSPQNIMVGADGVARLVDFGIAKAMGSIGHTREGHLKGKIPYMAPELLRYEPASPQTDVWASAVVLWETRCGRRLFRADTEVEIWARVLQSPIEDPGTVMGSTVPLDDVIMRGLTRDVVDRYPTALAMAEAIEQSTRLASTQEVAAWVASLASVALAERAALLRNVEGARGQVSVISRTDITGPNKASSEVGSDKRLLWFIPVIAAGAAALGFLFMRERANPRFDAGADASVSVVVDPMSADGAAESRTSSDAGVADASALAMIDAAADAGDAAAPDAGGRTSNGIGGHGKVKKRDAGVEAAASASAPPVPNKDCDPPYYVDESGRKRFKLDCVRGQ